MTLVGTVAPIPQPEVGDARVLYLDRYANAKYWVDFEDFSFYRLDVVDVYYVGGFGVMGWVAATDYAVLFIVKSRTMMTSWWMAGVCTHYVQTHPGMSCIYWAHEEKPAVKLIDYSKTLWQQQDDDLKKLYPLTTPDTARQAYNRLEYKHGGWLMALPGKDPGKIRSEHPTIVAFDEAAHIPNFADAYSVALLTKVPKMLAVSTAFPGDFNDMIEGAVPV